MYAARLYENSYSPDIAPISPFLLDYLRLRVDTHGKHVLPLPQTEHIAHDDTRACTRLLSIFSHPKRKTLDIDSSIGETRGRIIGEENDKRGCFFIWTRFASPRPIHRSLPSRTSWDHVGFLIVREKDVAGIIVATKENVRKNRDYSFFWTPRICAIMLDPFSKRKILNIDSWMELFEENARKSHRNYSPLLENVDLLESRRFCFSIEYRKEHGWSSYFKISENFPNASILKKKNLSNGMEACT